MAHQQIKSDASNIKLNSSFIMSFKAYVTLATLILVIWFGKLKSLAKKCQSLLRFEDFSGSEFIFVNFWKINVISSGS